MKKTPLCPPVPLTLGLLLARCSAFCRLRRRARCAMPLASSLALALLAGCTWIDPATLDARLDQLDDDGDGFARDGGDCDDADATIYPGADDAWYDGIDSDCAGDNDYDADNDGQDAVGTTEGSLDCNDLDATIYDGAPDTWYDGIDSDCAGDDDYDIDLDGHQAEGTIEGGDDCNDEDPEIYAGAPDTWYDGADSDCAGDDDFDADADGQRSIDWDGQDCDDGDPTIYFAAPDTWYDGIDSDCAEDDDYDADLDGYQALGKIKGGDDCDDQNPDAWPEAPEDLTDGDNDLDCDGAADSVSIDAVADASFVGAADLRIVEDAVSVVYLSMGFDQATWHGTSYADMAFALDITDATVGPEAVTPWYGSANFGTEPRASGHVLIADAGVLYGGVGGLPTSGGRKLSIRGYDAAGPEWYSASRTEGDLSGDQADLAFGADVDGTLHAFGCGGASGELQYLKASVDDLESNISSYALLLDDVYADACAVWFYQLGPNSVGTLGFTDALTGEYVQWRFDAAADPPEDILTADEYFTEISREAAYAPLRIDYPTFRADFTELLLLDDRIVVRSGGQTQEVVPTVAPVYAALAGEGDAIYLAWADADGDVGLAWGDLTSGFERGAATLPFAATEAAPWVSPDGSWLMITAMSETELAYGVVALP